MLSISHQFVNLDRFRASATVGFLSRVTSLCAPRLWTRARCVFVLSTGRTGTETLARLLSCHPAIDAHHEPSPTLLPERQAAFAEVYQRPGHFLAIFRRARRLPITHSFLRGKVYAETSARLTFFAPVICNALPRARFVYIHRHPAEVVRSGMRRRWYDGHPADRWRIVPPPGSVESQQWSDWSTFEKVCWYWKAYNRFALDFLARHGHARVFVLPFVAFARRDTSTFARLFEFLGVEPLSEQTMVQVLTQRFNRQEAGEFPEPDRWDAWMRQRLIQICQSEMAELGYSMPIDERERPLTTSFGAIEAESP